MAAVEYHVESKQRETVIHDKWEAACGDAIAIAAMGNENVVIDIVVWSVAGARAIGGDDAVKEYKEDPDASVFKRLQIKVNDAGRIP